MNFFSNLFRKVEEHEIRQLLGSQNGNVQAWLHNKVQDELTANSAATLDQIITAVNAELPAMLDKLKAFAPAIMRPFFGMLEPYAQGFVDGQVEHAYNAILTEVTALNNGTAPAAV